MIHFTNKEALVSVNFDDTDSELYFVDNSDEDELESRHSEKLDAIVVPDVPEPETVRYHENHPATEKDHKKKSKINLWAEESNEDESKGEKKEDEWQPTKKSKRKSKMKETTLDWDS